MFKGIEKKSFYTMERIWFPSNREPSEADIIRYNRTLSPMSGKYVHCTAAETIFTDLSASIDELLSKCTKTVKYEVNKCAKEDVEISFYDASYLTEHKEIVDEFEKSYIEFAKGLNNKEVEDAYQRTKVDNYIECNCILISVAKHNDVAVYHLYSCGGHECCLNYSVSNFRDDNNLRNLAGRMNKLLHIKDMEWFKERGYTLYDWGNISSSTNPNGIDKFKMSFGGDVVTVYNSFVGNSVKGKLLVLLFKLRGH